MNKLHHESNRSREREDEIREKMKRYWNLYKPSLESMMLSHDAQYLAENEQNELMSYLPPFSGHNILELGAGIGRFTSRFAQFANHVTAVDFMDTYIKQNEETNGHFDNITFQCEDVTKLDYPENSFDLVFSNWLLMYLTNSEVELLMGKVLRWLKPDGFFFFRESCYHKSGNVSRAENPTKYRTPLEYITMLDSVSGESIKFALKTAKNILAYIHYHGNPNQLCLLAVKKQKNSESTCNGCIEISDNSDVISSKAKPKITSLIHLSSGEFFVKNLSSKIGLRMGHRVLNIECGQGSIPGYLAENNCVHVHGIDSSPLNIHYAIEEQGKLQLNHRKMIQFEATKWADVQFTSEAYEAVLCFDMLFTKSESILLIKKAQSCLKHNGKLACLIFVSVENNSVDDYFNEKELENYFKSLSLTLHEMKPQTEMALKYLKEFSTDLKALQKDLLTTTQKTEKTIQNVQNKIQQMEEKKIKLVNFIVAK